MSFRLWLETSDDDTHPFEDWHKQWKVHYDASINRFNQNKNAAYKSQRKFEDNDAARILVVEVLELNGYSSGHHGWGDVAEMPASNPFLHARWTYDINTKEQEAFLVGRRAFISDHSWGSYHERSGKLTVSVIVNDTDEEFERIEELGLDARRFTDYRYVTEFFTFTSLRDAVDRVMKKSDDIAPNPVEDGQDSEAYWAKILKINQQPGSPYDPYNNRDDYYKK